MSNRRTFLKAAGLAPMLLAGRSFPAEPTADPSRVALVIGNNAYAQSPLANPVNDARAIGEMLQHANFAVSLRTDANRESFVAAIDQFGDAVGRSDVKLALFYYAGHGAQVSWKNYLLPVDAAVRSRNDLEQRCIDLNFLLSRFARVRDKTFVIILDACRDNPFGSDYQPDQKGLSQFDAPVGSLLAYATAPGSVAADGTGKHGLYSENLLKEFSAVGTSIEDAFKRVRINVRVGSNGNQIPWESTSLVESVFLFPPTGQLGEAEIERRFAEELATWTRIRDSKKIDDWVAYLREFPNGKFSEIAQTRLNRLLAAVERGPRTTIPVALQAKDGPRVSDVQVGVKPSNQAPAMLLSPPNPYSAGIHLLTRQYRVGDEFSYRESDVLTNVERRIINLRVTHVDPEADRVEFNHGEWVSDLSGNLQKMERANYQFPVQIFPAEVQVGKKWSTRFKEVAGSTVFDFNLRISARELIRVPAGEFDAFRIDGEGWGSNDRRLQGTYWLVPGLNPFYVKRELIARTRSGWYVVTVRHELVANKPSSA